MHARDMRLTRRARYALCGLFDLAYNGGGQPVRVKEIGARQGIPHRFLEQIFQDLRRGELVTGKRGPGGGYVLTRSPEDITLRQVVEAVEGPEAFVSETTAEGWAPSDHRPDFLWAELGDRMAATLDRIAISDLCREAAARSVDRELPTALDFQI
ncbi:MAG: Rrf2 family transcriptional regulator [Myxococcota bacterium]